ncbi:MAG: hypothetical protein J5I99_08500 [Verrucomicrobia bacterium]|nr:hypothetical protein [Verrucomicrobiota bacterium]
MNRDVTCVLLLVVLLVCGTYRVALAYDDYPSYVSAVGREGSVLGIDYFISGG